MADKKDTKRKLDNNTDTSTDSQSYEFNQPLFDEIDSTGTADQTETADTTSEIHKHKKHKKHKSNNGDSFFKKLKNWWPFSKTSGRILLIYLLTVLIGGFLLSLPGVVTGKNTWDLMTGIFTASSAFSDTGITLAPTNTTYTFWGQLLILIMIQIGGIGILTFKIVVYVLLGRKISLNDQSIAQSERGNSTLSNTVELIRDGFLFLTFIEILGIILLFFGFYFSPIDQTNIEGTTVAYHNFVQSLWSATFHSVSAVNNAGFDIISGDSLKPYNMDGNHAYMLQFIFLFQWVIGGLGYPTFHDIKKKIRARKNGKTVRFSLFTKLNFAVYGTLFIAGPLFVFFSELTSGTDSTIFYADGVKKDNFVIFMDILFNVTSCRNAGFSSVDINNFNAGSKLIMSTLMFIGSAPSSTAGGIRTTTLAICILGIVSIMRNRKTVDTNTRKIPDETVKRSFAVVFLSVFIVIVSVIAIYADSYIDVKDQVSGQVQGGIIIQLLVLVTSAFGTVGFSPFTGGTMMSLGVFSKFVLILVMFTGQLGISNTLLAFVKPKNKRNYGYLEEDVVIG